MEADKVGEALALPMAFPFVPIDEDVNFFQVNSIIRFVYTN